MQVRPSRCGERLTADVLGHRTGTHELPRNPDNVVSCGRFDLLVQNSLTRTSVPGSPLFLASSLTVLRSFSRMTDGAAHLRRFQPRSSSLRRSKKEFALTRPQAIG